MMSHGKMLISVIKYFNNQKQIKIYYMMAHDKILISKNKIFNI